MTRLEEIKKKFQNRWSWPALHRDDIQWLIEELDRKNYALEWIEQTGIPDGEFAAMDRETLLHGYLMIRRRLARIREE